LFRDVTPLSVEIALRACGRSRNHSPCRTDGTLGERGAHSGSGHACGPHATSLPGRIFGAASASATGICANQPCYIRNFTLLFPADGKNAPCSAKTGLAHKLLKKLVDFIAKNRLSLQFLKISLQIANCREELFPRGETFSLMTAYSATQSVSSRPCPPGRRSGRQVHRESAAHSLSRGRVRGARHSRDGIYRCGPERRNSRSARNTLL
jgi:hypothetical protein